MQFAPVVLSALFALAAPVLAQHILHVDFLVENPGTRDYAGPVWIEARDIYPALPEFDGFSFIVTTTNSPGLALDLAQRRAFELPSQAIDEDGDGKSDRVGVYAALKAGEKKVLTLHAGTPGQMVRLKGRYGNPVSASLSAGGAGAVWESEKVAYSWRRSSGGVFAIAKQSARPVFELMPAAQLSKVGEPVFVRGGPPPGDATVEVIASGPVAAGVRVSEPGAASVYVIGRNSRWTFVRTEYRDRKASLQIGLAKRDGETRHSGDGWIAAWAGEPGVGLAVFVPSKYLEAPAAQNEALRLRPGPDGRVEYAFAAYPAAEHQENVVEPGETDVRLPEVPGADRYGAASTRILLRPPRMTADTFRRELAADIHRLANPPRVTALATKAVTYSSLLPPEPLRAGKQKTYAAALDLMIRRVRSLTEEGNGKLWFSSDASGTPAYKDRSWGEGYLVSMLWDGFRATGDAWYKTAALAANRRMLGGEDRQYHSTGLNYWNASVRSYRETADTQWRASGLKCADTMVRIADPTTGLIPEYGPAVRQKPADPYHRSNYVKIDALVGLPILWWAYEETQDRRYLDAATRHMESTIRMFIEPDGAALQMLWLKPGTMEILGVATHQGYGGNSRWARGLAWVLDGLPDAYRTTRNPAYRAVFERSARWLEANLPEDMVPWYDFDDQAVFWRYRDSSTSAICAYGLLRMSELEPDRALSLRYKKLGIRIVDSLIDRYLAPVGTGDRRPAGMLAHACYTKPEEGEFIWGNYSLLRALAWLKEKGAARLP